MKACLPDEELVGDGGVEAHNFLMAEIAVGRHIDERLWNSRGGEERRGLEESLGAGRPESGQKTRVDYWSQGAEPSWTFIGFCCKKR